jgi:hypothetical protein
MAPCRIMGLDSSKEMIERQNDLSGEVDSG